MILIVSYPGDVHCQAVAQALKARGHEPALLDLSRFPEPVRLELRYGANGASGMRLHDEA